jgi:hypothetical protein
MSLLRLSNIGPGLGLSLAFCCAVLVTPPLGKSQKTLAANRESSEPDERHHYKIDLNIDFDDLSYNGSERVRWINRTEKSTATVYFHLYSNLRSGDLRNANNLGANGAGADEPRLEVTGVFDAANAPLTYSLDEHGTILRVNLREQVAPGAASEIQVRFKGTVPEIDPEETVLATHIVKQVSAALRAEREVRRARDVNFRCRGVMLLGTAYPVLAAYHGDEWQRKFEATVGDFIFSDAADYEVRIETAPGVTVFAPGVELSSSSGERQTRTFSGSGLRDFAVLASRTLRAERTEVEGVTISSVFLPEHERVGKRVLAVASNALRTFTAAFGRLPFKSICIAEAPLVAGLGSTEFSGFNVIASAFYVDFDSPAVRNLPGIIREQRPAVEESVEWTVAHLAAHQWWGAGVGNDPAREPLLDEALACWSALLYYKGTYGKEKAAAVSEDQVRGVYRLYRTFGGEDMDANRPARDFRNTFQYAAIVIAKGGLMFAELERQLGAERLFAALRNYYKANLFEIAEFDDLRNAIIAEAPIEQRRTVARTFSRWLSARRGDEDISPPDAELATSLGIPVKANQSKSGERNAFTAFARLGKFFWQQMTRIP